MKRIKNLISLTVLIFFGFLVALWMFSPYKGYYKDGKGKIVSKVFLKSNCNEAFTYLGDSEHASDWSVFVDIIEPIHNGIPDGREGSKRTCYTKSDHSGFHWEEEVLEVRDGAYRKLSCYNYQNLFMSAPNLVTEQIYNLTENGCEIIFTLDFPSRPGFLNLLKMKYAAYRVQSIFDRNLENIRNEILMIESDIDDTNINTKPL